MGKTKILFVEFLRYSPTIGVFCYMVHYALLPFGIRTLMADYFIDLSVLAYAFLLISSSLFGFCRLHRVFITYIFVASMDVDLHHWGVFRVESTLFMPSVMVGAGLLLFVLLGVRLLRGKVSHIHC